MKNAKRIGLIGQIIMIFGSVLYLLELLLSLSALPWLGANCVTIVLSCIYIVAIVLMAIGYFGTRDERKAAKEAEKAAKKEA